MLKDILWICGALFLFGLVTVTVKGEQKNDPIIQRKRNEIPRSMNFHTDPCKDFYEFACGSWEQPYVHMRHRQPIMDDPESYMSTMVDQQLRNMLEEQTKLEDGINGRKLKDFYKSCTLENRNSVSQQEYFSHMIESHGGFPAVPGSNWYVESHNYNWQDVVGTLRFQYGMNILVGVKIDVNYLYPMEDSLYLSEPDTILPPALCNEESTNKTEIHDEKYALIKNEMAENLNMWLSLNMEEAQKIAADLMTFEYQLCKGIQRQHTSQSMFVWQSYNNDIRKTLFDFTHYFDKKIDFILATFGAQIHKPVYMIAEPYFRQLINTLATTNKTTIANYIMYKTLSELSFPHNDQASKREYYCLEKSKRYFPKVLGEMYMRNHVNIAARDDVVNMFDKLKESFRMSLQKNWIEDYTRGIAESKLAKIHLLFPEYNKMDINIININRSNYWQNLDLLMKDRQEAQFRRLFPPQQINFYNQVESYETQILYRTQYTRFEMGWGLLQEPFYHTNYPNSIRYAVIGQKLASLLANTFNDISWSTTLNGTLNWDPNTKYEYLNRTKCFRQQISMYLYNDPLVYSNDTALREVIATSGGLNVAFNAYLNWLAFLQPSDDFDLLTKETLPEFNFTNTQLFFIAFAQKYCKAGGAVSRKVNGVGAARTVSPRERHSIERYVVNGPLKNFIEFARDFGCAMGVEMNPPDKCVIY